MGRKREYFNGSDTEEVEEIERNGSLVYVEKEDGTTDWVGDFELK